MTIPAPLSGSPRKQRQIVQGNKLKFIVGIQQRPSTDSPSKGAAKANYSANAVHIASLPAMKKERDEKK